MKFLSLLLILLLPVILIAQEIVVDSLGIDNNTVLNRNEVAFFNKMMNKDSVRNFDFTGKKIGFVYGNYGRIIITKQAYFNRWGIDYFVRRNDPVGFLIILSPGQKQASGGYDAIIISWSKIALREKDLSRIVKRLNRGKS